MKITDLVVLIALQTCMIYCQGMFSYNEGKRLHSRNAPIKLQNSIDISSSHSFDAVKYRLNFDMFDCFRSPYPTSYRGSVVLIYRMDSAAGVISLHASSYALVIDSLGYSGISFFHLNDMLNINLNRVHYTGETDSIKIYFRRNNVIDYSLSNNNGRISTFVEPEGARLLFPCWDRLNDKAFFDFTVKVPSNVKLGSNGLLRDTLRNSDSIYFHWVSSDPMQTYLFTMIGQIDYRLNLTYYHRKGNPADSIPIMLFHNPLIPPTNAFMQALNSITDYFSEIFVDYPFEKIGFANSYPDGHTNMEHQTLTTINELWGTGGIIPHEHGHQWFGDYITCETWADFWINEGFASYLEALYSEHFISINRYNYDISSFNTIYLNGNATMSFPIYNPSWINHTPPYDSLFNYAIIYAKPACVIHTLRRTVGDSLFFGILKSFMTDTNFAFKSASTSDFAEKTNQITGQNYQWFFDQWFNQPNHPVYQNTMNIIDSGSIGWKLYFTINQVQTNSGFYRMPVKIKINYSNNTDSFAVVNNTVNHQTFSFTSVRKPVGTVFDYDMSILPKVANSVIGINNNSEYLPKNFSLNQNYPNPFNASTLIDYSLPVESNVILKIYDLTGRQLGEIINSRQPAGDYRINFEGGNLASGVYFYKIEAGDFVKIRKMVLLK